MEMKKLRAFLENEAQVDCLSSLMVGLTLWADSVSPCAWTITAFISSSLFKIDASVVVGGVLMHYVGVGILLGPFFSCVGQKVSFAQYHRSLQKFLLIPLRKN